MHYLEKTADGTRLYVNANKTEFIYLKQEVAISTLSGKPLKLEDQSVYRSSNIPLLKQMLTEAEQKLRLLLTAYIS